MRKKLTCPSFFATQHHFIIIFINGCCYWRWYSVCVNDSPTGCQRLSVLWAAPLIFREVQQVFLYAIKLFSQHKSQSSCFLTMTFFRIHRAQVQKLELFLFKQFRRNRCCQAKNNPLVNESSSCLALLVVDIEKNSFQHLPWLVCLKDPPNAVAANAMVPKTHAECSTDDLLTILFFFDEKFWRTKLRFVKHVFYSPLWSE